MNDTTFDPQDAPPFIARAVDTPISGLRAKAVFVAMARRQATPAGSCFASDDNLAALAGCDARTVRRGRAELAALGRIAFVGWKAHSEHSRTKEWRVNMAAADSLTVPATPRRTDSPAAVDSLTPEVRREEKIKITPPSPRERGARPRAADRRAMGPDYTALHVAGIEAAETAVWSDCGDCSSPVLADMTRCPTCGSTTINARPVVGLAREDTMQTTQKPAPAPRLPAVPAVPAAVPAPPIVDPPFDPREAFAPQPKPTPVLPPDPEFADVLAAYQCIREAPLTDLERSALAELPPADTLSWLAQADGAEGLRGAA